MDHQGLPARSGTVAKWQTAPLIGTASLDRVSIGDSTSL